MTRIVSAVWVVSVAIGCGSPGAGGLDGTWTQTGVACNGTALTLENPVTLVINGSSGSISYEAEVGCDATEALTFAYPSASSLTLTHSGTIACTPAACASQCGTGTPDPDETFQYTVSGNTLTVSKVQVGTDGECADGQTVAYTLTR
jgi:hypothetical protein